MFCQVNPIKIQAPKSTSIDKAFALPKRAAKTEELTWSSPITAGPYLVPVTRWVE
jgi:hypothetical protein